MLLVPDSHSLTIDTDNKMAEAFDSEDESASAHELTELELQEIYDNIMYAPAASELLLHTSTRVGACHRPSPKPTPRARRESNTNTNTHSWYQKIEQNILRVFKYFNISSDRAVSPW